jgi:hypothetical protein
VIFDVFVVCSWVKRIRVVLQKTHATFALILLCGEEFRHYRVVDKSFAINVCFGVRQIKCVHFVVNPFESLILGVVGSVVFLNHFKRSEEARIGLSKGLNVLYGDGWCVGNHLGTPNNHNNYHQS